MDSLGRKLWTWSANLFAVIVILLALVVGLFRLLIAQLPEYHGQLENWASEAVGRPVLIGRIDARLRLNGPELFFVDAQIMAADGSQAMTVAQSGSVQVDLLHLLRTGEWRAGRVTLNGVSLDIQRVAPGDFRLMGQPVEAGVERASPTLAAANIPYGTFEFRNARVSFEDLAGERERQTFTGVRLHVERGDDFVRVRGRADPPRSLGGSLEFSAEATGRLEDTATLPWQVYLEGGGLALRGWREWLAADIPLPDDGRGSAVLWAAFEGRRLEQASAILDLQALSLPVPAGALYADLPYERFAGRFEWDRTSTGWRAAGHELRIRRGGRTWPSSNFSVEYSTASSRPRRVTYADASFIRIEDLLPFTNWFPDTLRDAPLQLDPRGDITDFVLQHSQWSEAVTSYSLQAGFANLGFRPANGRPGVTGLSGNMRAENSGGSLELAAESVTAEIPGLFSAPLTADQARGTFIWRNAGNVVRIIGDNFVLANSDLHSRSRFELQIPAGDSSPILDLETRVRDLDIAGASKYLPTGKMSARVYDWLDAALVSGRVPAGVVTLKGPLRAFPFRNDEGHFRAAFSLADTVLDYASNWPPATGMAAEVVFENAGLSAAVGAANVLGNRVRTADISIPDLREGNLRLEAKTASPLSQIVAYLRATTLAPVFGDPLADMEVAGEGELELDLTLPLRQLEEHRLAARLLTANGVIGLSGHPQRFEQVAGEMLATENGIRGTNMTALFLGTPVRIDHRRGDEEAGMRGATTLRVRGHFAAEDLIHGFELPLAERFDGSSDWEALWRWPGATVNTNGQTARLRLRSDLAGTGMRLPAPLAKPPQDSMNVELSLDFLGEQTRRLDVTFGGRARGVFDAAHDGERWRLARGAVRFGEGDAVVPKDDGLVVAGTVPEFDVGQWLDLQEELGQGGPALQAINLSVADFHAFGQQIPDVEFEVHRSPAEWLVQLDSERAKGQLFIPIDLHGAPLIMDMERLFLRFDEERDEEPADPRQLPAARVTVADFQLGDRRFGSLQGEISRVPQGLEVTRFDTEAPSFTIAGNASWLVDGDGHRSTVAAEILTTNLAETSDYLGYQPDIDAGEGRAVLDLNWPGAPDANFLEHISGNVSMEIGKGQINNVQPGAGRVFGLLSLSALPRRLSLDFSDVFQKGLGFDRINGDFLLDDGHAYTSNLLLEGPSADIGVVGRAGLARRDYDQTAVVRANLGATLPVAGVIAGGPVVGGALLIFSELFKKPLQGITQVSYRVTGSWDDPVIERVVASDVAQQAARETQEPS